MNKPRSAGKQNSKGKSRPKSNPQLQSKSQNRSVSRPAKFPKDRKQKDRKSFNKSNINSRAVQENEEQQQQNPNALFEKARLNSMSSDKQLQLLRQLHEKIVVAPEDNIKHIETMFALIKTPNLKVVSTALRVLAETFINIAPLDSIDVEKIQQRTANKITKDEYKVVKFEKILVQQYDRYLKMLREMHMKTKPENFKNDKEIYIQFKKCILECVIKCYRTLWNFNFNKQLNQLCLKFLKYEECRQFLQQMLADKNIALMGMKLKIVAGIARIIKNEGFEKKLPADIVKIINSTFIDTRFLQKDQDSLKYHKKQLKKKLYREEALEQKKQKEKRFAEKGTLEMKRKKREEKVREKLRVKQEVNKQFAQGQATLKNKDIIRFNSQVLQELFYIYFKILVQRINSIFLKDTLDGILKFVHLINIELTQSLLEHLDASAHTFRELWKIKKSEQTLQIRLLIVFTGESIINGPLSVYNMDDIKMTKHLYRILRDMNLKETKITKQIYRLTCVTLDQTFVKRRQLSQEIVGSFVREIAILLQQKQNIPKLYLLELIRNLAYKYSKLTRMFEADNEGFGLNSFNPMSEDPQTSNAINTEIISLLRQVKSRHSKQYQQTVDRNVERLCKQNFLQRDMKESLYSLLEREMEEGFF